ncbi:MAG: hypothetical protein ACOYXB_15170 [Bacteroidota bacterium]
MNTAYPLIPVTILTFMAFLATRLFAAWGMLSLRLHRKIWNYILLVSFLVSGLLGLLSVVKVNYKLEIPHYDTLLRWHVSFGIALVLIAVFHLGWHLRYYFSRKSRGEKAEALPRENPFAPHSAAYPRLLFFLGLSAITAQVLFLREFIGVLSGNELVTGIVLSAWMLLTGWGALAARKGNFGGLGMRRAIVMLAALSLISMLSVFLLYLLKSLVFPPGTLAGPGYILLAALLLLFPVCFLSGYLFTALSAGWSVSGDKNLAGPSYAVEALGSLAGGVLFTLLLGRFFTTFQVLGILTFVVLAYGALLTWKQNAMEALKLFVSGVIIAGLIFAFNPDLVIRQLSFPNQEILANRSTRYGNVVLTRQAGQLAVYENNELLFYTDNTMLNEESVHFAMVQHPSPKQVLLLSGGMAGMIPELLKYGVDRVTVLESNPELFGLQGRYTDSLPGGDRLQIVKRDIRRFVATTDEVYDVILINLPPPATLGMNRFYTEEFFRELKQHCNKATVVCTGLPSTANYAGESALEANAVLWKTLGQVFSDLLVVQGERNYFLASDSKLSPAVAAMMKERNIAADYVNEYYIDDGLLAMRSEELVAQFSDSVSVNHDTRPALFNLQIGQWLSHFGTPYRLLIILPAVLFLLLFFRTDRISIGLYTGGFSAAALELVLLLAYQVSFGSIYLSAALFFAVFMAGLALGSSGWIRLKYPPYTTYLALQFLLALLAAVLPAVLRLTTGTEGTARLLQPVIFILLFLVATVVGLEFMQAATLRKGNYPESSGGNYGTDLTGSALGVFLTAIVLLPWLGVVYTCLTVAGLNIVSGIVGWAGRE